MTRIKDIARGGKQVRDTSRVAQTVDPNKVASVVGAELLAPEAERGSPVSLFALRQELARRLVATGGRWRLMGTSRRQKIPVGDTEWSVLECLAQKLGARGRRVSAGQLVGALVRRAVAKIDPVEWLTGQLNPPDEDFAVWLFAQALRRKKVHLTRHPDDVQHLVADARHQAERGEISEALLSRIESEKELAKAYGRAVEAADLKLERALQEIDWAERGIAPTRL